MSVKRSTFVPHEELIAACSLAAALAPRLADRVDAVRRTGSCQAAMRALGLSPSRDRARDRLRALRDQGFEALCLTHPDYPRLLRVTPDPPLVLSVWGRLLPEDSLAIAIVGYRRATRYGLEMSRHLASGLAASGLTIVSGLARGIDAAAHEGALRAGGRTVAVLGSGLLNVYPREHRKLAEAVAEHGAVLSELDLDASPLPGNFPRRNRIITGMTLGTLIVEAALKSGSLVSARLALEQDREVFAVPGPARSENSAGVHALLRDGAALVTRSADVLEELRPEIRTLLENRRERPTESPGPELPPVDRAILTELATALDVDTLLERVEVPTHEALAALSRLELQGRIWRLPGGLYQARPCKG